MNPTLLAMLNESEQALVRDTERLDELDEDDLLATVSRTARGAGKRQQATRDGSK